MKNTINKKIAELAQDERCEASGLYCSCIVSAARKITEYQNKMFVEILEGVLSRYISGTDTFSRSDYNQVINEMNNKLKQLRGDKIDVGDYLLSHPIRKS